MHIFLLRLSGILALLCCSANFAQAAGGHEGWYQVELIVFARRNPTTEEFFPNTIKLRYPNRWIELKDPNTAIIEDATPTTTEPYWQLPAGERKLNDQARKLEVNPNYQLLFHQAWRQQITNARQATSILINGGRTYGKHTELEGSITLSVATYLKITTNLWLSQFEENLVTANPETQQNAWPEIPLHPNYISSAEPDINNETTEEKEPYKPKLIVLMKQERDMRSSEVHYLDHPFLGVIVRISPYRS